MNMRDRTYVGDRLISPCMEAQEAYGRLRDRKEWEYAEELMDAMQQFSDRCREIRRKMLQDSIG